MIRFYWIGRVDNETIIKTEVCLYESNAKKRCAELSQKFGHAFGYTYEDTDIKTISQTSWVWSIHDEKDEWDLMHGIVKD